MGTDGHIINQQHDGMRVADQQNTSNVASRSLVFEPLNVTHGGNYRCEAKLMLPNSAGFFNTTREYHLDVLSKM